MTLHLAILDMTPVAQTTKGKINWTSWKLETFVQQKGYQQSKKTTPRREKMSQIMYLIRVGDAEMEILWGRLAGVSTCS